MNDYNPIDSVGGKEVSFPDLGEINLLKERLLFKQKKLKDKDQEISALKEEVEKLKYQYMEFYNFNSSALFTIDDKYQIQTVNFQGACLLNFDRNQLIHKNFLDLMTNFHQNIFKKCVQEVLTKQIKQACVLEMLQKGGERRSINVESLITKDGYILLILKDITYVRQLESQKIQLNHSLETVNNLLQNVSDAIATLDKEFYFKVINPSFINFFSRIFAIKIQLGMNFFSLIMDASEHKNKLIKACNEALQGKETTFLIENFNELYEEVSYCFELHFTPIFNPSSQETEIALLIKDLTEFYLRKKLTMQEQSRLAHAVRLNTMEGMASALAHEINQPLTAIFLYSQTCLSQLQQKDNTADVLPLMQKIISQTQHASEIMRRMKTYIHTGICLSEETDINALINDALIFLDYELTFAKLKVTLNCEESLPLLKVDRIQIMQVILNLARNSIEAMKSTENEAPELIIETQGYNDYVEIHVRDNGPGIPQEHRDQILRSFFTTKPQGTGLGLSICQNLVEAHGGKLYAKNSESGAWFVFTLPMN